MARKLNRRGKSTTTINTRRAAARRRTQKEVSPFSVELLEPRVLLSYTFGLVGTTATVSPVAATGGPILIAEVLDAGNPVLEHSEDGGATFSLDWDDVTLGVQTLPADTGSTVNLTPTTGAGSTITLGDLASPASAIFALINLGPAGTPANNSLTIDDRTSVHAAGIYDFFSALGTITGPGGATGGINFTSFGPIHSYLLEGGPAGNTYNIHSTFDATTANSTILGGAGNDTANVLGDVSPAIGTPLSIDLGGGTNTVHVGNGNAGATVTATVTVTDTGGTSSLSVDDQNDTTHGTATLDNLSGNVNAPFEVTGLSAGAIQYSAAVTALNINGGTFGGAGVTYDINNTQAVTTTTINGGTNRNFINLSNAGENAGLDNLPGAVVVNGGAAGTDVVTLEDSSANFSDNYTVTSTTISRSHFSGLTYGGIGTLTLNAENNLGTNGNNLITVDSTANGVTTNINGQGGDDTINVNGTGTGGVLNVTTGTTGGSTVNVLANNEPVNISSDALATVNLGSTGGPGTMAGILGTIDVTNPPAFTTVNVHDENDATGQTWTLLGGGATATLASTVASTITYTQFDVPNVNIHGGTGNDTLVVDNTGGTLISNAVNVNFDGGAGLNTLQITGNPEAVVNGTYTPSAAGAFGNNGTIDYVGTGTQVIAFENLAPVEDLSVAASFTINNALNLTTENLIAGPLSIGNDPITGNPALTYQFNWGGGAAEFVNFRNKATFTLNGGSNGETITENIPTQLGDSLATVNLNAGAGVDEIDVLATPAGVTTNTDTQNGVPDSTVIGGTLAAFNTGTGTLDNVNGPVVVTDSGGVGQLYVDDSGTSDPDTFTLTSTTLTGTDTAGITYDTSMNIVQLALGSGDDTVNVTSDSPAATTSLFGNDGNDTFNVSPVLGVLNIDGGAPTTSSPVSEGDVVNYLGFGAITPTGVGAGFVTQNGFATVNFTNIEAATTVTPGVNPVFVPGTGWVVTATGDQDFIGEGDQFTLSTQLISGSTYDGLNINEAPGTYAFFAYQPAVHQFNIDGAGGDDNLTVDSTAGLVIPVIFYDGGLGLNTLTLSQTGGTTQTSDVYSVGPYPGEGTSVITGPTGVQSVTFQYLAPVLDTVPATTATVNATAGANAINYTQGTVPTNGLITIDNQESYEFSNKVNLIINGLAGSDQINLNDPVTPTGLTTITVNGGDPTGSGANGDTLIVNGVATSPIDYSPTSPGNGGLIGAGPVPITFTTTEQLVVNGQDFGNALTVTTVAGFDQVTLTPGAEVDSGSVQITSTITPFSDTPVDFVNLGNGGSVVFADGSGGRADTLIYNGTAANDTFSVPAGTGAITLNHQLPVSTPGVANLVLNGLDGDDTFNVAAAQAYTSITLLGGAPSASDVANLVGDGALATATMDSATDLTTVVGGGLGTVTLSGVELVTLDNSDGAAGVTVNGTVANDAFGVSQVDATQTAFTVAGLDTTLVVDAGAGALTLDPLGGANSVTYTSPAGSAVGIAPTPGTVDSAGYQTLTLAPADVQSLNVTGQDNAFAVTTAVPVGMLLTIDGVTGSSSVLSVTTAGDTGVEQGATPDAGRVFSTTNGSVTYAGIADLIVSGSGADSLTILGTGGNDAIDQTSSDVTINNGTGIAFDGYTTLSIAGMGGDDVINVNPTTLVGITTFNVDGGSPTASDKVIVNGTTGADAIGFAPLTADSATVTGLGPVLNITTTELVVINGQGGNDTLTVTTPAGANTVNYTPGVAPDAGSVQVDSLVPMTFQNIGATGTVALADAASTRSDTLVYNGTVANDAFGITGTGNVTLTGHVALTSTGATAGLTNVTINGISGNDTFTVASGNPYTTIALNGGASLNDVATLTGNGTVATAVRMDSATELTTVTGGGLATTGVTLSGIEQVNVNNIAVAAGSVQVDGTALNDAFSVNQTSATQTTFTLGGFNTTVTATKGATGTLTLDAMGGANSVTVNGTTAADTINVLNAAGTTLVTVVGYQPLTVTTADTQALYVSGGLGNDTFNVSGTAGPALTVDGGLPTASDTLNITNTTHGTTTVNPGTTADSGTIATPDYAVPVSFVGIEHITLTGVLVGPPLTDTLVLNGTSGSDLMSLYNTGSGNTALVNNHAPVVFSNFGPVVLNGVGGDDTFNVSPVGLTGVTAIAVNGAATAGGTAEAIVNGSSAADTIVVTSTSATTATVAITGSPTVTIDPVTSLVVNGLGGNDAITATSPVTALDAPITLNGGVGNDSFSIGTYTGQLVVDGGQGSDTLNFAGAPGDPNGFGVTVDLDKIDYAQTVNYDGETVDLLDSVENFVGSSFNDKVFVDASPVPRSINGGLPNQLGSSNPSSFPYSPAIPPGDQLIVDGQDQFVTDTHSNVDSGSVGAFGYSPITFAQIEKITVTDSLGTTNTTGAALSPNAYTAPVSYGVNGRPTAEAVGDINGDGYQDMVVASRSPKGWPEITVLMGNGDGTFTSTTPIILTNQRQGYFQSVQFADVNGDGKLDIVALNPIDESITVLTGNGNGTFGTTLAPFRLYTSAPTNYARGAMSLTVGDVNNDGLPDFVTANYRDNTITVMTNTSTTGEEGSISFLPPVSYMSGGKAPADVTLLDVNGDGYQDILAVNAGSKTMTELTNQALSGPGLFGTAITSAEQMEMKVTNPQLTLIPVANPGFSLTAHDNLDTALGLNTTVKPPTNPIPAYTALVGGTAYVTGTYTAVPLTGGTGTGATATIKVVGGTVTAVTLTNHGNGYSVGDVLSASNANLGGAGSGFSITVAVPDYLDYNGDGKPDVLLTATNGRYVTVLKGNGSGGFTAQPQAAYTGGLAVVSSAAADVNGDGRMDIVLALKTKIIVLLGNGNGTFGSPVTYSLPVQKQVQPQSLILSDLDNDGGVDIVLADALSNLVSVLLSNPA